MEVLRFDFNGSSADFKRTPQGFLRVNARLTKTGIFSYENGREFRSDEEVFRALWHLSKVHRPSGKGRIFSPGAGNCKTRGNVDISCAIKADEATLAQAFDYINRTTRNGLEFTQRACWMHLLGSPQA